MGLPEFESGSPAPKAGRMDHCSQRLLVSGSYPTAPLTEECRPISMFLRMGNMSLNRTFANTTQA